MWAELVRGYDAVKLTKKDKFIAESATQFYEYFESADEDANAKPLDNDQQIFLYKLLEFTKRKVEQAEDIDKNRTDDIVEDIASLQASIPAMTKAAAIKKLSQIFAKVKVFSLKVIVDTFDIAKKELIKAALYGGLHEIDQVVHLLP